MNNLNKKILSNLSEKNLSVYKLSKLIGYSGGSLSSMIKGKMSFSKRVIEKILPILKVSKEEFESWMIADRYPKEIIEKALAIKKNPPMPVEIPQQKTKITKSPILTAKIDKLILEKQLSRTKLSKLINYDQITLNRMILGMHKISGTVVERLSEVLEVSQDDISAWVLADKYSLDELSMAWDVCTSE